MASTYRDKSGCRGVQVMGADGKRHSIRFGRRLTDRRIKTIQLHVEDLADCRLSGDAPKTATAEWLADVPSPIRARLEKAGLVGPRQRRDVPTVAAFVRAYIAGRTDIKPSTRINLECVERELNAYLPDKRLDAVNPADADGFRIFCKAKGLGEGTTRRHCGRARQLFRAAVKARLIAENPFAGVKVGDFSNPGRFYFVTAAEAAAVLESCPNAEWRLIFALCRWGGLRCPSEVLRLKWGDIDWDKMRFTVHAVKTEGHSGAGIRQVPIFPELYPHLRQAFEDAPEGAEYCVTRYRDGGVNLRTQLGRIIERAGLTPWGKLFQNCRSTRETELVENYPVQVVTAWLGNSPSVARKHYLQVTDEHFRRAIGTALQNPVQIQAQKPASNNPPENEPIERPLDFQPISIDAAPCASMGPQGTPRVERVSKTRNR